MTWLIVALCTFAATAILHARWTRMGNSLAITYRLALVAIPVGLGMAVWLFWRYGIDDRSVAAIVIYGAFCEIYLFLFTLAANGVSVSLMLRLADGAQSPELLREGYNTRVMIERRIEQMKAGELLSDTEGRLKIGLGGARVVRFYRFARHLFRHDIPGNGCREPS